MVDEAVSVEPDYVGYIEKTGERRLSIHIPPDMIDALPVGVTELYSRTPSAPSAGEERWISAYRIAHDQAMENGQRANRYRAALEAIRDTPDVEADTCSQIALAALKGTA